MQMSFDRRTMIMGLIGATATGGLPASAALPKRFFRRIARPIGLQLYTLGDAAKTDLEGTLARVAEIGFAEIELPGLLDHPPADLRRAADAAKLTISALHVPVGGAGPSISAAPQSLADLAGVLGVQQIVAPMFPVPAGFRLQPGVDLATALTRSVQAAGEDPWKRLAQLLNERAAALRPHGLSLSYHNHSVEFLPIGATTGWDILARETDPQLVYFEIDIGWVTSAGLDPAAFLARHQGRVRQVHVKDVAKGLKPSQALATAPTEVGTGVVDWARVLPAAYAAGARNFYVEQEPPFLLPRLEAARRSYAYLSSLRA
jgi:sugar phosphate isomerase/epimerase